MRSGCSALSPRRRASAGIIPSQESSSRNSGGSCRPTGSATGDCDGWCSGPGPGPHFVRPGDEGLYSSIDWAAVKLVSDAENPVLLRTRQGSFDAVKLSDFLTRRELHRTRLYHLVLKPRGLEDSLGVRLRLSSHCRAKTFLFDRGGRNFSARDRAVLDLLSPYLVQLHRASENRRHLRAALAMRESTRAAVVLLEDDDRISDRKSVV